MNVLRTENIYYKYENTKEYALNNISICINNNDITSIIGGNGAGKSTLFLVLNGILKSQKGHIFLNNKLLKNNKNELKKLRQKVGIVFQDPNNQLFSASVRDDIAFGALNIGIDKNIIKSMVEEIAFETGVYDLLDLPTQFLSFGQKKRVAIAGVLIMKPEVIILDEPTAGLDPKGVSEILKLLEKIKKDTKTSIVLSTHDIDLIPLYCDYTYVLDKGKIILEGTPKEIFSNPSILRQHSLRIPRITHLMEIMKYKDNLDVDITASTISQARKTLKELVNE